MIALVGNHRRGRGRRPPGMRPWLSGTPRMSRPARPSSAPGDSGRPRARRSGGAWLVPAHPAVDGGATIRTSEDARQRRRPSSRVDGPPCALPAPTPRCLTPGPPPRRAAARARRTAPRPGTRAVALHDDRGVAGM